MAIITCSECGKEISDKAPVCVYCGYKLVHGKNDVNSVVLAKNRSELADKNKRTFNKKKIIFICLAVAVVVLLLSFGWKYVMNGYESEESIIGIWETVISSDTGDITLRNEYGKNGEFHSYTILYGIQIPGGDGTYVVKDGVISLDMSFGESTDSKYTIDNGVLSLNGLTWIKVG